MPIGKIAERIEKSRNTVRAWWDTPEFQKEVRQRIAEHTTSMKLRQSLRANVMGEALFNRAATLLQKGKEDGKLDIGQAQLVFRELRDWQREEREIHGDRVQKIEERVLFNRADIEGGPQSARTKAEENLVEWLEREHPNLTILVTQAKTQEDLVEAMRQIAYETDLIDVLQEAAREEERERLQERGEANRKR